MNRRPGRPINNIKPGDKFGLWTVIKMTNKVDSNGNIFFECQCECGYIGLVRSWVLKAGRSNGCRSCASKGYTQGFIQGSVINGPR